MPLKTRLVVKYGPVAGPLFGVGAAIGLLLADLYCRAKWVQPILIVVLALLAVYMFDSLLFSYFGPVPRLNKVTAANAGETLLLQCGRHRPGIAEFLRSAAAPS